MNTVTNEDVVIRAEKKLTPGDAEIQTRLEIRQAKGGEKNRMRILETLQHCADNFTLAQIVRQEVYEGGRYLIGVPVVLSRDWIVLVKMDDAITLDGFDALRVSDVTKINTRFRRSAFYRGGLRSRRARVPALPKLDLRSTQSLLRSAQRWFALLTIDREHANPGGAEVGQVGRVSAQGYAIRLLTPDAKWVRGTHRYATKDVTRVGFGGTYEETLAQVAALPDPKWR